MSQPQRMLALAHGHRIRTGRYELKLAVNGIHSRVDGCRAIADLIEIEPVNEYLVGANVYDTICDWVWKLPSASVKRILLVAQCSEFKTFGQLTIRQRTVIVRQLRLVG